MNVRVRNILIGAIAFSTSALLAGLFDRPFSWLPGLVGSVPMFGVALLWAYVHPVRRQAQQDRRSRTRTAR